MVIAVFGKISYLSSQVCKNDVLRILVNLSLICLLYENKRDFKFKQLGWNVFSWIVFVRLLHRAS